MSDGNENKLTTDGTKENFFVRFLRATEIDSRMLGMIGALLLIWLGFHYYGAFANGFGSFLTPRNLWNLSVQTSSIAIMATGMVLIIVTRHIDLSVGSLLGLTAMVMGVTQAWILPEYLGLDNPMTWVITVAVGIAFGTLIGAFQGFLVAYMGIPAFIVTLGGLLAWRGASYRLARGETIAPLDSTFNLIGGGPYGTVGSVGTIILAALACVGIFLLIVFGRRQRVSFGFPLRPMWAEWFLGVTGCGLVIGTAWVMNSYPWPKGVLRKYAEANNIDTPVEEMFIAHGLAIPVLIAIVVGIFMTFLATRTRFGRYVFAMGGNPEAAELAGINTKRMTVKIFALMGALVGISAVIASARLNSATLALGQFDELYVIAAAVIGGTSLAGGVGTIFGAMLGALVFQSLQSGMILVGFDLSVQQMVVGAVLVIAVWLDTIYRRRAN